METLLSQQLQQAWLDIQMRKKHQESQQPSLQEITLPSTASSLRPLFERDHLSACSVPPLPRRHVSSEDQVSFHDPVLQYINDMLMEEDTEKRKCMQQVECTSYQATAKGFYDILGAESSNGSGCKEDGLAMHADECSGGLETLAHFEERDSVHGQYSSREYSLKCNGHDSAGISSQEHERALGGDVYGEYEWMNALLNDVVWGPFESDEAIAAADSAATLPEGKSLPSTLRNYHSYDACDFSLVKNPTYYGASMLQSASSPAVVYMGPGMKHDHIPTLHKTDFGLSKENTFHQPLGKLDSDTLSKHIGRGDWKVKRAASQVDSAEVAQLWLRSSPLSAKGSVNAMVNLSKEEVVSYVQSNDLNAKVWTKVFNDGPAAAMVGEAPNSHPASFLENTGKTMDLKSLLLLCAHAVAENEAHKAHELLQVIRQHTSLFGSAEQRLAHYFSEGLLACLSNTGGQLFTAFVNTMPSAAKMLEAYRLFVEVCPFFKLSHYFANKASLEAAEGASRLHIVDYGILYGLQWPSLISALAERRGGPPVLRITGIDCPRRGSKLVERVEVTGQMLSEYAKMYGVPFEYHAVASKFESVQPCTLHLQEGEVLVVNSMFRLRHLLDESTVPASNPRKTVLSRIQAMNPKVFVQGVKSANYNSPFFMSRFKEALTFYSYNFDMVDSTINRDKQERMTIEREMMGRDIINVVACEGPERIERPETYKQWENRTPRAGFEQMPLTQSILSEAQVISQATYNKNFSVEQDGCWVLLGWKGKALYGLSVWRPCVHE